MKYCVCDVCGKVLDDLTPHTMHHESDMFGYDLCPNCKMKEKLIDMRAIYLAALKDPAKGDQNV